MLDVHIWGMFDGSTVLVINDMGQSNRPLLRILRGTSDANIPFEGLCQLLRRLGLDERAFEAAITSSLKRESKRS
jgi:hypothetical protein